MIMTLQQAIENPLCCEDWQLKNWLNALNKYYNRDTGMAVKEECLDGRSICPACGKHMALAVESFCDKCGQKIKWS